MITTPAWIDKCYKAVKEKNPDLDDSSIYAICWNQYNKLKEKEKAEFTEQDMTEVEYEVFKHKFVGITGGD